MPRTFLRRRYIVDWKLQGSLCAHGLLSGGLLLAAIVCGVFAPLLWDLGGDGPVLFDEAAIVMIYMHERLWVLVAGCAVIVVLTTIRLSHRIAGPMVRYKRNLRLVAAGKLPTPLRTRRHDYLKEEVACLNAAVAGVATRVAAIRRAQQALQAELAVVAARAGASGQAELASLLAAERELATAVGAFAPHDPGDERARAAVDAPLPELALGDAGR